MKNEKLNPKRNTGFLHISTEKSNEQSPDFFGTMDINGVIFDLGGWKKESEKGSQYISMNFDISGLDKDSKVAARKDHLKDFKADKKNKENKDKYMLIEQTGVLHKSTEDKKEDFFGKVRLAGEIVNIVAFAMSGAKGNYLLLKVNDGIASKEERTKIAESFI